jgi:hypothetical protein
VKRILHRLLEGTVKSKKLNGTIFIMSVTFVGLFLLNLSRAATFSVSVEPEAGVPGTNVAILSDPTASGGGAAQFGSSGFVHPGVLVSKSQLDFVKAKIANNQEPWKSAFESAKNNWLASKNRSPQPVAEVKCSTSSSYIAAYPQAGCPAMRDDANRAYTLALMWYYTGDQGYANEAIETINAWASTHKKTWFDQPRLINGQVVYGNPGDGSGNPEVYASGLLVTAWTAQTMSRAAEIIRYSNAGWSQADIQKAETYFKTVHLDALGDGWTSASNWLASVSEAWVNIGIFTNDKTLFDKGINYWRQVAPPYMYNTSDGSYPKNPFRKLTWVVGDNGLKYPVSSITPNVTEAQIKSAWGVNNFINGLGGETCRDIGHLFMGFGGIVDVAETARIQGIDLYGEQKDRIIAAYELNASYMNQFIAAGKPASGTWNPPDWRCNTAQFKEGGGSAYMGLELVYNHYNGRQGISMPNTQLLVEYSRPSKAGNHLVWETLTHYGTR